MVSSALAVVISNNRLNISTFAADILDEVRDNAISEMVNEYIEADEAQEVETDSDDDEEEETSDLPPEDGGNDLDEADEEADENPSDMDDEPVVGGGDDDESDSDSDITEYHPADDADAEDDIFGDDDSYGDDDIFGDSDAAYGDDDGDVNGDSYGSDDDAYGSDDDGYASEGDGYGDHDAGADEGGLPVPPAIAPPNGPGQNFQRAGIFAAQQGVVTYESIIVTIDLRDIGISVPPFVPAAAFADLELRVQRIRTPGQPDRLLMVDDFTNRTVLVTPENPTSSGGFFGGTVLANPGTTLNHLADGRLELRDWTANSSLSSLLGTSVIADTVIVMHDTPNPDGRWNIEVIIIGGNGSMVTAGHRGGLFMDLPFNSDNVVYAPVIGCDDCGDPDCDGICVGGGCDDPDCDGSCDDPDCDGVGGGCDDPDCDGSCDDPDC
ncbi:MAG: hypothetical protein FWE21_09645, partial [Defluviitaleaceae bacterium]|nr:hypothetical protein [Defluviitaleaceae bacterium]